MKSLLKVSVTSLKCFLVDKYLEIKDFERQKPKVFEQIPKDID